MKLSRVESLYIICWWPGKSRVSNKLTLAENQIEKISSTQLLTVFCEAKLFYSFLKNFWAGREPQSANLIGSSQTRTQSTFFETRITVGRLIYLCRNILAFRPKDGLLWWSFQRSNTIATLFSIARFVKSVLCVPELELLCLSMYLPWLFKLK